MEHQRSRRPTRVTASQQCAIRIGQRLVRGKKVYFVLARGGVYTQGPMQQLNFQGQRLYKERFLRHDSHLDTAPSERLRHHRQFSADVFGSDEECKSWAS